VGCFRPLQAAVEDSACQRQLRQQLGRAPTGTAGNYGAPCVWCFEVGVSVTATVSAVVFRFTAWGDLFMALAPPISMNKP